MASELILRGFNPDPSICRVGDDYYVATSTFEWYPGVQIHHSRDLKSWRLVARPLAEARLLDLRGVPDSCGVWAPDLSYADGRFWLVYTIVRRFDGRFKDTHNFVTTAPSIDGPWSDRAFLNSSGFDPGLFHDADGSKWLLNMVWDYRPDHNPFAGIVAQRYDSEAERLTGEPTIITRGAGLGCTEGPHLYRHEGRYHLILAEGGTGYEHAVVTARADALLGPYAPDPAGPLVTSAGDDEAALHRRGHGSLVETPDGRLFVAHLASRSRPGARRSPMGRESAMMEVRWSEDGWLRPLDDAPSAEPGPFVDDRLYRFDGGELHPDLQWLRSPEPDRLFSLRAAPGALRLYGREALGSLFESSLVARRRTGFSFVAEAEIDVDPADFQHMAGLVLFYNGHKHHYLYVSRDEAVGRHLGVMSNPGDLSLLERFPLGRALVPIAPGPVRLRATVDDDDLRFAWSQGGEWRDIGPVLDASALSDETGKGEGASFTGTFVGVCAQDLSGRAAHADVSWFRYRSTGADAGDAR